MEITPVARLDGRPLAGGAPGPVWHRVYQRFRDYKRDFAKATGETVA